MATGVYVPIWGLEMTEATVSEWLRKIGDTVRKGESIVIIETYKISGEVESPVDGVLRRKVAQVGEVLKVGSLLGVIGAADEDEAKIERLIKEAPFVTDIPVAEPKRKQERAASGRVELPSSLMTTQAFVTEGKPGSPVRATPLARKIALEKGLDLRTITGSGPAGRIYRRDVESAASQVKELPKAPTTRPEDKVVVLTTLRKAIINKAMQTVNVPYGALSRVVRMDNLMAFRQSLAEPFERKYGLKLTLTHLFFKATAMALQEVPILNSTLHGENIIIRGSVNLGMVVSAPGGGGIIIPVIKDVQSKSLDQLAQDWATITEKIQRRSLLLEDLSGGTFTISNVGAMGIDVFTPLIHPPESAILGISRIQEVPVIEDGQIVAGWILSLIVGADHRVFDAEPIGQFLTTMDRLFQKPSELII